MRLQNNVYIYIFSSAEIKGSRRLHMHVTEKGVVIRCNGLIVPGVAGWSSVIKKRRR